MGAHHHVALHITEDGWTGKTDRGDTLAIGASEGTFRPYELLLLALASCLQSTFEDVAEKMKLSWSSADVDVQGDKRDEVPTTLESCCVSARVTNASDEQKVKKAFDIATRYCSIYQTIAQVARMEWEISFSD